MAHSLSHSPTSFNLILTAEEHARPAGRGIGVDHLRPLARAQPGGDPGADAADDLHAVAGRRPPVCWNYIYP